MGKNGLMGSHNQPRVTGYRESSGLRLRHCLGCNAISLQPASSWWAATKYNRKNFRNFQNSTCIVANKSPFQNWVSLQAQANWYGWFGSDVAINHPHCTLHNTQTHHIHKTGWAMDGQWVSKDAMHSKMTKLRWDEVEFWKQAERQLINNAHNVWSPV